MINSNPTCRTCKWWFGATFNHDEIKAHGALQCRRKPPDIGEWDRSVWPKTRAEDWCGDHEPAKPS